MVRAARRSLCWGREGVVDQVVKKAAGEKEVEPVVWGEGEGRGMVDVGAARVEGRGGRFSEAV